MAEVLLGGNSPDRTQRFVRDLQGPTRGVRSAADPTPTPQPAQAPQRQGYVPTEADLKELSNQRLRDIAERDLGLTVPDDAFKPEIVALILEALNADRR